MIKKTLLFVAVWLGVTAPATAQTLVFQNARILTADQAGTIEQGSVVVKDGRIVAVGTDIQLPAGAELVNLNGKTLTPGLVASDSLLGIVEISGGANAAETASRNAVISAGYDVQYAINPYSSAIGVARKGGITRAVVMPNAGPANATFAGQAAVLSLGEGIPADIQAQVAVVWDLRASAYGRGAAFVQLKADLADVRKYARSKSALVKGELLSRDWSTADLDALVPVIEGRKRLAAKVDRATDILALINISREEKIKLVLVGAAEGWKVAEHIARAGIPVMVDLTNNLPSNFDEIAATSENAARLFSAGVPLILRGGSSAHDAGKLRYFAGMAVARGLPYDAALQAVTATPARLWGATDVGTIAAGQQADIAIWSGDPFEPLTELVALYIRGKAQPLISRQEQLEDKYIDALRSSLQVTAGQGD